VDDGIEWMFCRQEIFSKAVISYLMLADRIEEASEVRVDHAPFLR
jgi:hypothetical protein